MKRMLCIVGAMNAGGAETFLMKVYRTLDKEKYQMDFCVAKEEKGFYDDEIIKMGGKIYHITPKSKNPIKNFFDIKNIVKNNRYKYVLRVSQHSLSAIELFAARLGGAKKIAFRSSNSNSCGSKINTIIHYIFRPIANLISNVKIAPSKEAAVFMFGRKNFEHGKVMMLNNGIDYNQFKYQSIYRTEIRNELNIPQNAFVLGHVGRFTKQKNHQFLIEVFKYLLKTNNNSYLIMIGEGELKQEIIDSVNKLNIADKVRFLNVRSDVNKIYSAMDCYLFPSFFEGMPNSVIEAECNGLPCIISNKIDTKVKISNTLFFEDINNISSWVKRIETIKNNSYEHKYEHEELIKNGYDINSTVAQFTKIFD